jgi:hypothetical protein
MHMIATIAISQKWAKNIKYNLKNTNGNNNSRGAFSSSSSRSTVP